MHFCWIACDIVILWIIAEPYRQDMEHTLKSLRLDPCCFRPEEFFLSPHEAEYWHWHHQILGTKATAPATCEFVVVTRRKRCRRKTDPDTWARTERQVHVRPMTTAENRARRWGKKKGLMRPRQLGRVRQRGGLPKWHRLHAETFRGKGMQWPVVVDGQWKHQNPFIRLLSPRKLDTLIFDQQVYPESNRFRIALLGQAIDRQPAAFDHFPCVVPNGMAWSRIHNRIVFGVELLAVQGLDIGVAQYRHEFKDELLVKLAGIEMFAL